jgi:hypothetical protein
MQVARKQPEVTALYEVKLVQQSVAETEARLLLLQVGMRWDRTESVSIATEHHIAE